MGPISVLMKPSSSNCNMQCSYCFYRDEAKNRDCSSFGYMSEDTLRQIVKRTIFRADTSITYAYQGGEPTLRGLDFYKEAVMLQKKFNKNSIEVFNAIQTNGLLLDEEWCKFFKENNFLVGISLDGIKDVHDLYRKDIGGNGTFDKVMNSISLLEKHNVEYNILTVVNSKIASRIDDVFYFYKDKGFVFQQYIACLDPLGQMHGSNEYALKPIEYGKFLVRLFDLWYCEWEKGKQPYIRQFENYIGILVGYIPEACEQRGKCGNQYVVEADGSVYPCDFYMLDGYRLGNFNDHRLDELDEKRKEIGFVAESHKLTKSCLECMYYKLCRGGCRRNRDYNAKLDSYEYYFCEGMKYFFDNTLERMQIIANRIQKTN